MIYIIGNLLELQGVFVDGSFHNLHQHHHLNSLDTFGIRLHALAQVLVGLCASPREDA